MDAFVQAVVLVLLLPRPSVGEIALVVILLLVVIVAARDDDAP